MTVQLTLKRVLRFLAFLLLLGALFAIGSSSLVQNAIHGPPSLQELAAQARAERQPVWLMSLSGNSAAYVCGGADFGDKVVHTFIYHYGQDEPNRETVSFYTLCRDRGVRQRDVIVFDNACLGVTNNLLAEIPTLISQGCGREGTARMLTDYLQQMEARSGGMFQSVNARSISSYLLGGMPTPKNTQFILEAYRLGTNNFQQQATVDVRDRLQTLAQYGQKFEFSGWADIAARMGVSEHDLRTAARYRRESGFKLINLAAVDISGFHDLLQSILKQRAEQAVFLPGQTKRDFMVLMQYAVGSEGGIDCSRWVQDLTESPWGSTAEIEQKICEWYPPFLAAVRAASPQAIANVYRPEGKIDMTAIGDWVGGWKTWEWAEQQIKATKDLPAGRRFQAVISEARLALGEDVHFVTSILPLPPPEIALERYNVELDFTERQYWP